MNKLPRDFVNTIKELTDSNDRTRALIEEANLLSNVDDKLVAKYAKHAKVKLLEIEKNSNLLGYLDNSNHKLREDIRKDIILLAREFFSEKVFKEFYYLT